MNDLPGNFLTLLDTKRRDCHEQSSHYSTCKVCSTASDFEIKSEEDLGSHQNPVFVRRGVVHARHVPIRLLVFDMRHIRIASAVEPSRISPPGVRKMILHACPDIEHRLSLGIRSLARARVFLGSELFGFEPGIC